MLKLLNSLDALRRPTRLDTFLLACEADKRGRLGHEEDAYPQADFLRTARATAATVDASLFVAQGMAGPAMNIAALHLCASSPCG